MTTGLIYHERFLEHITGDESPETPDRLRAIVAKLKATHLWEQLHPLEFEPVTDDELRLVHDQLYLDRLEAACRTGLPYVDVPDSAICTASYEIARLAAGGAIAAARAVATGQVNNAFCAIRPPGHHAERDCSMGFCLLNNVALAAQALISQHGMERVAIIDFDVHHGNGTQHIFEQSNQVFFCSMHEHPTTQYPGTGFSWETGKDKGEGYTLNITFDSGHGDDDMRMRVNEMLIPALEAFRPEMILLSSGFDASEHDHLGNLKWSAEGFIWLTRQLKSAAENLCDGKLVSVLEGGYNLQALAECVALHVGILLEPEGQDQLMAIKAGL